MITPRGSVGAKWVVNAAGVAAGAISTLAGGEELHIWPRKGQYWILDRAYGERLRMIVLPVPMPYTRGVQVVPTTNGSVLLGPDAQDISDPDEKSTEQDALATILEQTMRLVPSVTTDYTIKTYAANRAASDETVRARPDKQRPNLIQVGNRSTGVSASPGTADRVLSLLRTRGLEASTAPTARAAFRGSDGCCSIPTRRRWTSSTPATGRSCAYASRSQLPRSHTRCPRAYLRDPSKVSANARGRPPVAARARYAWLALRSSARCTPDCLPSRSAKDPAAPRSESAVSTRNVAVVGAGIAGLTAAIELATSARVTVYDRLPVAGGVLGYEDAFVEELRGRCNQVGVQWMLGTTAVRWARPRLLTVGPAGIRWVKHTHLVYAGGSRPATAAELGIVGPRLAGIFPASVAVHFGEAGVVLGRRVVFVGTGDWAEAAAQVIAEHRLRDRGCRSQNAPTPDFRHESLWPGWTPVGVTGAGRVSALTVTRSGSSVACIVTPWFWRFSHGRFETSTAR